MSMNKEGGEALLHPHGKGGLLLHLILLQVMVKTPLLRLDPKEVIIHVGHKGNILPGSALKKLHQSFEREARM